MSFTNTQKGIVSIIFSAFGFALMALFVRLCDDFGGQINSFQKSLFRNAIAFLIALGVFFSKRNKSDVSFKMNWTCFSLLSGRSLSGLVGIWGNFYALSIIPIGEAITLNKTATFFTLLFSWLFLKEKIKTSQFIWLSIAFLGVMCIMKPGFQSTETFAMVCALVGGLGAGIAYTCVRKLGSLKTPSSLIVLFFSGFSILGTLPFLFFYCDKMTLTQTLILLCAGVGAAIGQFGITLAYRFAPARDIVVFDYTSILFSSLFGFLFFEQIIDVISLIGFVLIVLAAFKSR